MHTRIALLATLCAGCVADDSAREDTRTIAAPEICEAFELSPDETDGPPRGRSQRVTPAGAGTPGSEPGFWSAGAGCWVTGVGVGGHAGSTGARAIAPACLLDMPTPTVPQPDRFAGVTGLSALEVDGRVWSLTTQGGELRIAYRTDEGRSPTTAVETLSGDEHISLASESNAPWIVLARTDGSIRGLRMCTDEVRGNGVRPPRP